MNYKEKSEQLEKVVAKMENDDLSLEEMVKLYEEGTSLYRELEKDLKGLEQKVRLLTEGVGEEGESEL
ncbi:MAG: exodeoxyribonuclease VII small subunit [Peptoniphilus sp.]|nr:exodeoxyribonuclease VII small subunit [Peptoniphilus sp.]MDY3119243.1 exodeoxyribonuclease VII small subunit [Peptoniphilus sp.]